AFALMFLPGLDWTVGVVDGFFVPGSYTDGRAALERGPCVCTRMASDTGRRFPVSRPCPGSGVCRSTAFRRSAAAAARYAGHGAQVVGHAVRQPRGRHTGYTL